MKITKTVVEIGNGAAVYVPREYRGREVVVMIPEGIEEIRKDILSRLIAFMPNILGVYLYGSYARGEEGAGSDIDILIITKEKDKKIKGILRVEDAFSDVDVRVLTLEEVRKSIKNFPALMLPILKESKAFLNSALVDELKDSEFDVRKFRWHFQDVKRILGIIKTFVEIDDKDISPSHIYSLIMRIRICYMIESLLKNKSFSNKAVKSVLLGYGLDRESYERFDFIYKRVREDKNVREKIDKKEILKLVGILTDYSKEIEREVQRYGKKKEKTGKRN
tara:strand:+ start:234 stop:1067 length:834 start_codon:yes stop_codon:yes gene_type:complete